ncbi:MAG: hypothetical protein HQ500_00015 [Flavobacteriales bacterium]|nr:hypothetical protein [Flavobacteriales bacterium]
MKNLILLLTCFVYFHGFAQVGVKQWRSHLPMSRFDWVGELEEKVYGANSFGVIAYDREDGSIQDLTKINVLSQTGISNFACSYSDGRCIIGYSNGNLDIIDADGNVTNQPAIVSSNIIGDKAIRDIFFYEGSAYLATGIGVVELDLMTYNVNEYSQISYQDENIELNEILIHRDTLFATSPFHVFAIPMASLFIGPDLKEVNTVGDPDRFEQLFLIDENLYAIYSNNGFRGDTLFQLVGNAFIPIEALAGLELRHVQQTGDQLLIAQSDEVSRYTKDFQQPQKIFTYGPEGMDANMAIKGQAGDVLIADGFHGLVSTSFENQFNSILVSISSPRTGYIGELEETNEVIYAMPGGNDFTFNQPYLFRFEEEEWKARLLFLDTNVDIRNTSSIIDDGDRIYVGFDGSGLMILDAELNVLEHFSERNAQIEDDVDGYYGLKGMELDDEGNLWMLNSRATSTLSILDPEGNWTLISLEGFPKPIADNFMRHSSGIFAFSLKEQGVVLYDPAGTPTTTTDDRFITINSSPTKGNLPNNTVNCIVEDKDGELWIGTDEGVGVIYSVESMFSSNADDVQRIIVNQDGYNGYLFASDAVITMTVDGANRKWVGPRGAGLFLISQDGQEQLEHFTEDDSPLLNDNILDLVMHPSTGELFIATESGLQSYRTDASEPAESLSSIRVFPNPVKPGYGGVITFSGLTDNSYLRVTDVAGNLIYETTSKGGTAIWNGLDRTGAKVTSGIYLIQAARRDGTGGALSKLMFLN